MSHGARIVCRMAGCAGRRRNAIGGLVVALLVSLVIAPAAAADGGGISGTVTDAVTHAPLVDACVDVIEPSGGVPGHAITGVDGEYTASGLAAGTYRVGFRDCAGRNYVPQFYEEQSSPATADPVTVTEGNTTSGINAALQPGGWIRGTVIDADTELPVQSESVTVFDTNGNVVGNAYTNYQGIYIVGQLASGNYKVSFSTGDGTPHAPQFYDDKWPSVLADLVPVTAGDTTSDIDAALDPPGRISGTVTDATTHEPIAGVCVKAYDAEHDPLYGIAYTDEDGNYTLSGLGTADYDVGFTACGGGSYMPQFYSGKPSLDSADPVPVTAGEMRSGIDVALEPAGTITGTVTDAVTHLPLAGMCVGIFESPTDMVTYEYTNDEGGYTFLNLTSGSYKVGFVSDETDCPSGYEGYAPQFYNDKPTFDTADPISITSGVTASGIDAALHSSTIRTLTVSVAGSGSGKVTGHGIDCPGTCSHGYPSGEPATVSATPAAGSTFAGWSGGGCSGTGPCTVTMNSDQTVTATFTLAPPPVGKPSVTIAVPAEGASYVQDQVVGASYSCAAATGATLASCSGPLASGHALDTHVLGAHTFTVTATDNLGSRTSRSVRYTVIAKRARDVVPVLTKVRQSSNKWRAAVGTTFSFTLNVPAKVSFVFTQKASGRKVGKACVPQTSRNRKNRTCTRTITVGALTVNGHSGANAVRFRGRISPTIKLRPGSYTVTITATNATGKRCLPAALRFTIVK